MAWWASLLMKTMSSGKTRGFSLIELLGVVAIVAILLAIVLPLSGRVSDAALRAKTKTYFSQYALALERYRQTYGDFPEFLKKTDPVAIRGVNAEHFIAALSTQELIAGSAAKRFRLNPDQISFYQFSENELLRENGVIAGVLDAQGEEDIFILVDQKGRGMLPVPQSIAREIGASPGQELVASILIFTIPLNGGRSVYFYE